MVVLNVGQFDGQLSFTQCDKRKLRKEEKGMRAWIVNPRIRLRKMLILVVSLFVVCGLSSIYGDEKAKPDLEIKRIKSLGTGPEKIRVPGVTDTVYVIGTSKEKIFRVKIKNNTKQEKQDVKVKLSVYDKNGKLIGEESPRWLTEVYAKDGYSIEEGTLSPRKTVEVYFVADKRTKYLKAELFCEGELVDAKTEPSSFKPLEKE